MGPLGAAAPLSFVLSAAGAVVAMVSVSFMFAVCVEEGHGREKEGLDVLGFGSIERAMR